MKKIYILFGVIIILVVGCFLFYTEGTLPVSSSDKSVKIFTIDKGENVDMIIKKLEGEGLIRSRTVFYLILKQTKIDTKIQAGNFSLSPSMTASEIANNLTVGTLDIRVTVVEGIRKEEIAQLLSKELSIPEIEFVKNAKEGYLFPDTYSFSKDTDVNAVLETFNTNFSSKFTQDMRTKIAAKKMTMNQVLTLASLVEREARLDADRAEVASIIYKRYKADWALQIDATVQYAVGYQSKTKSWWKQDLTFDDLKIDSPYNTYKNTGLPPGPICNPGLSSIMAAVNADESTPYWFYISDKTGKMHYGKTLEEHDALIAKYLQ